MNQDHESMVIGIMHCGDLGTAIARLLREHQYQVVVTCDQRSPATVHRAKQSGATLAAGVKDLIAQSDVVFSVVDPEASVDVANQFLTHADLAQIECLFVDCNSIGPVQIDSIQQAFALADRDWVDATIHGGARQLSKQGVVYASGRQADLVTGILSSAMRSVVVSETVGDASLMKQTIASFSKSMNAMFVECALLANANNLLSLFLTEFEHFYPGIFEPIKRMLPTFCNHIDRRIIELANIEELAARSKTSSQFATAARQFFERYAADFKQLGLNPDHAPAEQVEHIISALDFRK